MAEVLTWDTIAFTSQYRCIFGIADPVHGLPLGETNMSLSKPVSFLTFIGLHGEVYFFLYQKMDKKHKYPSPKFTDTECEALANANLDKKITGSVTFGDIWKNRRNATLLAMDEGIVKDWSYGRIVLLGDSAHKMTVNLGQGGNSAIEDAAGLANALNKLNKEGGSNLSTANIVTALKSYENERRPRLTSVAENAATQCRVQDIDGPQYYLMATMMRHLQYPCVRMGAEMFATGTLIDFLPQPQGFDRPKVLKNTKEYPMFTKDFRDAMNLFGVVAAVACFAAFRTKIPFEALSKTVMTQMTQVR